MTTPAEDKEMAAFVAWAVKKYGQHAYRHTSATSGEWAAWQAGRAALPAPLSEGALMGVYMEFDRHADKTWTPAEYLLHFAAAVQRAVLAGPNWGASALDGEAIHLLNVTPGRIKVALEEIK